jgi:predicted transcriptional regulator of viral defense system
MKLTELQQISINNPVIKMNLIEKLGYNRESLRRQLNNWINSGDVVQLKKGLYLVLSVDKSYNSSKFYLANIVYGDNSYISLESALSFYGLIPERVDRVTSVTTSKTKSFQNSVGIFEYKSIKKDYYDYFTNIKDEYRKSVRMATAEKALLDFIYLRSTIAQVQDPEYFENGLRLQNLEILNTEVLDKMTKLYSERKMNLAVSTLKELILNA